jgi:WD40 repeat protein
MSTSASELRVIDAATGTIGPPLKTAGMVMMLSFAPDGAAVAGMTQLQQLKIWKASDGAELWPSPSVSIAGRVAFSADGRLAAVAAADRSLRILDRASGRELARLTGHSSAVSGLEFLQDGTLVSASSDTTIRAWRVAPMAAPVELNEGPPAPLLTVRVSPDQQLAVLVAPNINARAGQPSVPGTMKGKSLESGRELFAVSGNFDAFPVPSVAFDGLGRRVAITVTQLLDLGDERRAIRPKVLVFDALSGREIATLLLPGPVGRELSRSAPDPKGDADVETNIAKALTVSGDGRRTALVRHKQMTSVRMASAGTAGLGTPLIDVWETTTGRVVAGIELRSNDAASSVVPRTIAFDATGGRLAVAASIVTSGKAPQNLVRVYDVASGRQLHEFADLGEPLAFSADGTRLAGATTGRRIRIFDVVSGAALATLPEHGSAIAALAFSPDNTRLASVTDTGAVTVWHPAFLRQALVLRPSSGPYVQRDATFAGPSTPSSASTIRFSDDGVSLLVTMITSDPRGYHVSARRWDEGK